VDHIFASTSLNDDEKRRSSHDAAKILNIKT